MAARAGVSEGVFPDIFPTTADCYRAAFEDGLTRLSRTVDGATARKQAWLERVRSGLVALLGFFDDEPSWGLLLLSEAPAAGSQSLRCEQRLLGMLTQLLDDGSPRTLREPAPLPHMTAELVAGGTFAVIRARALEKSGDALVELASSLMAFIVRPYLGEVAARAELAGRRSGDETLVRPPRPSARLTAAGDTSSRVPLPAEGASSADGGERAATISLASQLPIRATHRTTQVLRAIARAPYSNNREVAQAAGLADEGQTSKLLARLERQGVVENVGMGAARGEPNAWLLTADGRRVLALLVDSRAARAPRRASGRVRGAR